ncbi:peptide chain release factor N(5)-glutamine methyltransferase [Candidatus Uhrbacteria bacterium]|nr:peptide chain release factor N(5)-glutamine methyltransferase [Candidatus Uhrbacteria bacterium]
MLSRSSASTHPQWQQWVDALTQSGIAHAAQEVQNILESGLPVQAAVDRRCRREPLAYIVGWQPFYHRRFSVNRSTLVPRPETEHLMQALLMKIKKTPAAHIVDCGTGCGAIAITLKAEIPTLTIIATDINESTLAIARENAVANRAVVDFRLGNLLEPVAADRVDGIIANLPYLPTSWNGALEPELSYEPEIALFAGNDGLDAVRLFVDQLGARLWPLPWVVLELLPEQVPIVSNLLKNAIGGGITTLLDLSGAERFILWDHE